MERNWVWSKTSCCRRLKHRRPGKDKRSRKQTQRNPRSHVLFWTIASNKAKNNIIWIKKIFLQFVQVKNESIKLNFFLHERLTPSLKGAISFLEDNKILYSRRWFTVWADFSLGNKCPRWAYINIRTCFRLGILVIEDLSWPFVSSNRIKLKPKRGYVFVKCERYYSIRQIWPLDCITL